MVSRLALTGLAALLAGCATISDTPLPGPAGSIAAERGSSLAEQRCGSCHALGPSGESRQSMATPFRGMSRRYNAIAFERRMTELDRRGHGEMPPVRLTTSEASDLVAYIRSLGGP